MQHYQFLTELHAKRLIELMETTDRHRRKIDQYEWMIEETKPKRRRHQHCFVAGGERSPSSSNNKLFAHDESENERNERESGQMSANNLFVNDGNADEKKKRAFEHIYDSYHSDHVASPAPILEDKHHRSSSLYPRQSDGSNNNHERNSSYEPRQRLVLPRVSCQRSGNNSWEQPYSEMQNVRAAERDIWPGLHSKVLPDPRQNENYAEPSFPCSPIVAAASPILGGRSFTFEAEDGVVDDDISALWDQDASIGGNDTIADIFSTAAAGEDKQDQGRNDILQEGFRATPTNITISPPRITKITPPPALPLPSPLATSPSYFNSTSNCCYDFRHHRGKDIVVGRRLISNPGSENGSY